MNENVLVKKYQFNNSLIQKIDSLIDNSIPDCHKKWFHTFDYICEYNLNFTYIIIDVSVNFTFSDKNTGLDELNKN